MKVAETRSWAMSERAAASRLQKGTVMKWTLVGFLAVAALSGCGVGVDDAEGQEAAALSQSAPLLQDKPSNGQGDYFGALTCTTCLPQDPIPNFDSKSVGGAPGTPLPEGGATRPPR
jgi:hypothetical protein